MSVQPFLDSTEIADDGAALAERMARDGYLFVRGLLPAAAVHEVRTRFLAIAAEAGWLQRDRAPEEAVADPAAACVDPEPAYVGALRRMYVLEPFHALKHHPRLVGLFERMLGQEVLVHPLIIARNIFPQRPDFTTPAHQDYVHIQGTTECFAAWIPLHDCPLEMGGLQIAAGSHLDGVRPFRVSTGAGGLEVAEDLEGRWVSSPFAAGDVLIFHSLVVHKGLPNHSDRLRQSVDARFQRASDPVCPLSLQPYANILSWDEIYAGWRAPELQYYWRRQQPTVVPYDMQYYEARDAMAFEMAARGDRTARAALLRVVQRDRDEGKRARARSLLERLDGAAA